MLQKVHFLHKILEIWLRQYHMLKSPLSNIYLKSVAYLSQASL
jgi:hypothetical protein